MYTWSVNRHFYERHPIARLTQLINFGLNGEKIDGNLLRRHFPDLTELDPARRRYLGFLLYDRLDPQ
jgi:hypothetical protein